MTDSDEKLVEIAREALPGDLRAFDELVRRHQVKVQTNCRYLSGNEEDALDLAQEVLVKAYFNLDRFAGRSQFGTWLNRIKVNHCLNHLRRRRRSSYVDIESPGLDADPALRADQSADDGLRARNTRERISAVLDDMGESLRVPLIMRDLDGMSYQEIADRLDLGLSAVKMRIKRAREEFKTAYAAGVHHG